MRSGAVATKASSAPARAPSLRVVTADFSTNEDPISQGGIYLLGQTDGTQWGDFKVVSGKAYGKRANEQHDNTALVKGPWANDQYVEATVWKGTVDESFFPEVELRLRSNLSANVCTGYEVGWSCRAGAGAYFFVARWNGPFGDFAYITNTTSSAFAIANGDVLRAEISGSTIRAYRNGAQIYINTDITKNDGGTTIGSLITSGFPGLGTNQNDGGDSFLPQHGFTAATYGELAA